MKELEIYFDNYWTFDEKGVFTLFKIHYDFRKYKFRRMIAFNLFNFKITFIWTKSIKMKS